MSMAEFYCQLPEYAPLLYLAYEELVADLSTDEVQMLFDFINFSEQT